MVPHTQLARWAEERILALGGYRPGREFGRDDRDRFASKAFGPKTPTDGTWVEVIGNEIIGRTVRIVE